MFTKYQSEMNNSSKKDKPSLGRTILKYVLGSVVVVIILNLVSFIFKL